MTWQDKEDKDSDAYYQADIDFWESLTGDGSYLSFDTVMSISNGVILPDAELEDPTTKDLDMVHITQSSIR